jgi:hypothetical protein
MSVGKLIDFFSRFTKLPIYAEDVKDQIVDLGVQDVIEFHPIDEDPRRLRGMYFRYRVRAALYSDHDNHSIIFYNANVPPDEQNFICCKELMHVFDDRIKAAVKTAADFEALLSVLFKTYSDPSEVTIGGVLDLAAEFAALAVMFPEEIRNEFLQAHLAGRISEAEIAAEAGVPEMYVRELLSERWETVLGMLRSL